MRPTLLAIVLVILGCCLAAPAAAHPSQSELMETANRSVKANPNNVQVLLHRAELYVINRQHGRAMADLRRAARLEPNRPKLLLLRGLVHARTGRDKAALADLQRFLDVGGEACVAWQTRAEILAKLGQSDAAVAELDRALVFSDYDVDVHLQRTRLLVGLGRLDEAAKGGRTGLANTGSAVLRELLIEIEINRGQPQAAIDLADEIIPDLQVKIRWRLLKAKAQAAAGETAASSKTLLLALNEANALMKRRPTPARRIERATVLIALGKFDDARDDLRKARTAAPNNPQIRALLEDIRSKTSGGTP